MKIFIAGGAGFIGSHLAHRILKESDCEHVTIYDNFTSGKDWHIADIVDNPKVTVVRSDIKDIDQLSKIQKVIFASSGGTVYGIPQEIPIKEDHPTDPSVHMVLPAFYVN